MTKEMFTLMERVDKLRAENIFLGGPSELFDMAGRMQLMLLVKEGLYPESKVLDIGCGCLRAGYWLIHFLNPSCYFGIEPNRTMLEAGFENILEPGLIGLKRPKFDGNADFDFSVFGERFDFFVARSIWTHASKIQIRAMLDGFVRHANRRATFLTSYVKPSLFRRSDYKGTDWVGRSHTSDVPGIVRHSLSWIRRECQVRQLPVEPIRQNAFNFGGQKWLRISTRSV